MSLTLRRSIAILASLLFLSSSVTTAQAAMLGNDVMFSDVPVEELRQQLRDTLNRDDVRSQLLELGADPNAIDQRISHLTPAELAQLNGQLDELPAGAGVGGLIVLLFLVFVVTDAIGATDLFTFIKPVNR